ncbi:hypothetical protein EMQ_1038 [Acetobacter aceti NBRC 14818]|uniref:Uncharacterized protein n=1 Tax=Acetobacter aceti NBRC 14818 TaxID=887700 RepID=A0AB33IHI2_ACEAC|nr:hypothetical protein EMQ_1038 [Acetobacter aceti NBRC 14818]GAN58685.1 hypothetical protein Abac_063_020 [Acetobacter aceti NBRC 14818]
MPGGYHGHRTVTDQQAIQREGCSVWQNSLFLSPLFKEILTLPGDNRENANAPTFPHIPAAGTWPHCLAEWRAG